MLRYMGTKRRIASSVLHASAALPAGPTHLVDLFSGSASIGEAFVRSGGSVTCSDALAFPGVISRARFLSGPRLIQSLLREVVDLAERGAADDERTLAADLEVEDRALSEGQAATADLIARAVHVANDSGLREEARAVAEIPGRQRYRLCRLYFSRGYFSTRQSIHLDALRWAIDQAAPEPHGRPDWRLGEVWSEGMERDGLLAAWILTASVVSCSPGHTAQHLTAASPSGFVRVRNAWRKNVFSVFAKACAYVGVQQGLLQDARNSVMMAEALSASGLLQQAPERRLAIYADPPYTKDHYSRYYHVLETLFRYDFPEAHGKGRVRADRHLSDFSFKTRVADAFDGLGRLSFEVGKPLIVSYPSNGLLQQSGFSVQDILGGYGNVTWVEVDIMHSTMGGRQGVADKAAVELVLTLIPKVKLM